MGQINLDFIKNRRHINRKIKKPMWKNRNIDLKFLTGGGCFKLCFGYYPYGLAK
ncbi:hypothetical protein Lac2_01900 [Claveliimonas bilis]|nr:hypothetical protein Lac2_01900 [Claveliimonas bilis]